MALLALIWGATFLFTALALREVPPLTAVAFRLTGGMVVLWLVFWAKGHTLPRAFWAWGAFLVMGLLNNILPFSLITWGQQAIPSGLASILNASTAMFGIVTAALFLADERLTVAKALGALIAFVGVIVTIGWQALASFDPRSLGQLAVLGAALCYAFAGIWARKTLTGFEPLVLAAGMVTMACLTLWPVAIAAEGVPTFTYSATVWGALLYQGALATSLAYLLYYRVLAVAGSGNLMLVTLLLPPIAILLGALILGERIGLREWCGFAIIALGLIIIDGRAARWLRPGTR